MALKFFRDALDLGVLTHQQNVHLLSVAVEISQVLFERTFETRDIDDGGTVFLQIIVVALPPDADAGEKFILWRKSI